MKQKKRHSLKRGSVLVVFCIMCLLASALAGCGGKNMKESKYLGKWNAVSAEMSGMEFSVSDFMDEFSINRLSES